MAAYLIVHGTVKDADKLAEYGGQAGPLLGAAGGELVTRAKVTDVLAGSHAHDLCLIFRFPDGDALRGWYNSDAYQALIPLRNDGADLTLIVAEEPPQ